MGFEPEIIGFVCNNSGFWHSQAVVSTPFTSKDMEDDRPFRMEVHPVDCVGALPTPLVTEAIEKGADAVLIIACGEGLCHYFEGERRLETKLDMIRTLLEDMGMEPERIFFKKVSDRDRVLTDRTLRELLEQVKRLGPNPMKLREGPGIPKGLTIHPGPPQSLGKAEDRNEALVEEAKRTGVVQCLECGKCTASCPVAGAKPDFSPMYLIEKALRTDGHEVCSTADYWNCLTCASCSHRCPSDVDFVEFIRFLRTTKDVRGAICTHGGQLNAIWKVQAQSRSRPIQNRMGWVTDDLDIAETGDVLYFVGCLPYFDVIFERLGFKGGEDIARNVVRILNAAGITPAVMRNEVCCGHDALWNGDKELFEKLASEVQSGVVMAKPNTIVCSCPECYRTLKKDYTWHRDLDIEVKHISEYIVELIEQGRLELPAKAGDDLRRFTYHDPCRLVRHSDIVEQPRKVMEALPNTELVEMERSREISTCCGTSCWSNCNAISEKVRTDRLLEAQGTGTGELVTSCPKCQIHFRCTMSAKPEKRGLEKDLRITDLVTLVASYLGGGEG